MLCLPGNIWQTMTAMIVQKLKEVTQGKGCSGRLFSDLSFVVIYLNANLTGKKKGPKSDKYSVALVDS